MRRLGIRIANLVLFTLCCFLAANVFNQFSDELLRPAEAAVSPPEPYQPAERTSWAERRIILDRNVFGSRKKQTAIVLESEPVEELEETKLPLLLLGTAAAEDREVSNAAVQNLQTKTHQILFIGDRLEGYPKVTVDGIERRRVVLQNGPKREELRLGEPTETKVASRRPAVRKRPTSRARSARNRVQAKARAARKRAKSKTGDEELTSERIAGSLRSLIDSEADGTSQRSTADLFSQARIVPKYEEGEMIGIELNEVQSGSFYEKIGLSDGDVIVELNGIQINSPAASAKLLTEFAEAPEFDILVSGAGGERPIRVDADRVSSLLD